MRSHIKKYRLMWVSGIGAGLAFFFMVPTQAMTTAQAAALTPYQDDASGYALMQEYADIAEHGGDHDDGGDGGSSITGIHNVNVTLKDSNGTALSGQQIGVACGMSYTSATTNASGVAAATNLTHGNCVAFLITASGYYAPKVQFTIQASDTAQTVSVDMTAQETDINLSLTVTDKNGAVAPGVYVFLTDTAGRTYETATNGSGVAQLGIFSGTYRLDGYVDGSSYPNQYFPDETITISTSGVAATPVTYAAQLQEYTSFISGTVKDTSGNVLASPRLVVYSNSGWKFLVGESNGTYTVGVEPDSYTIKGEKNGYANNSISGVAVAANQTVSGQDITLAAATNTLNLSAVDGNGANLGSASGYTFCGDAADPYDVASFYVRQLSSGSASFTLPDGSFTCQAFVTGYAAGSTTVTLSGGETKAANLVLLEHDATIQVSLVDNEGATVTPKFAVYGVSEDGNIFSGYSYDGNTLNVAAVAGTYKVRVHVMDENYTTSYATTTEVTVTSGATQNVEVRVYPTDATIDGTVTDSNGTAAADIGIKIFGQDGAGNPFQYNDSTNSSGIYSVSVVPGEYTIRAVDPTGVDLPSNKETVTVEPDETITHNISLLDASATLNVTPDVATAESQPQALSVDGGVCYAYEDQGSYRTAEVSSTGTAQLALSAGTWNYGCRVTSGDSVYASSAETSIELVNDETQSVNATVAETDEVYEDIAAQFSASADNIVAFPDGEIHVSANTLDTSGNVSIMADLSTNVAVEADAVPLLAVDLEARDGNGVPITGEFNSDVTVKLNYTDADLAALGLDESALTGASYDKGSWKLTDQGFDIDTENNVITITTNHFSSIGILGEREVTDTGQEPPAEVTKPKVPRNLKASKIKKHQARLTWKNPKNSTVSKYQAQVRKHKVKKQKTWNNYKKVKKTVKVVKKLKSGTRYQFRVRANNSAGWGKWTNWKAFTTK